MFWLISYVISFVVFYFVGFRFYEFHRTHRSEPWKVAGKVKFPTYTWIIGICIALIPICNIIAAVGILLLNIINLINTDEWDKTLRTFKLPEFLTKKY